MKKNHGRQAPWSGTIMGEPASKSNSRKFVTFGGKPRFVKSDKAIAYLRAFRMQCPTLTPMFTDDLMIEFKIFYASRRPDLDESLILDAMQGMIYENDRQVKRRISEWGLDRDNPRTFIRVSVYDPDGGQPWWNGEQ